MVTGFSITQTNLVLIKVMKFPQNNFVIFVLLPPFSALGAAQEITWAVEEGVSVPCATPCQHKFQRKNHAETENAFLT